MYFPRNGEFGSAFSEFRGGGGFEPPNPPFGTPLAVQNMVIHTLSKLAGILESKYGIHSMKDWV
jgi:hypothetical protein